MNASTACEARPDGETRRALSRRLRVLSRFAIRKLLRVKLVETDVSGHPKTNPTRWLE